MTMMALSAKTSEHSAKGQAATAAPQPQKTHSAFCSSECQREITTEAPRQFIKPQVRHLATQFSASRGTLVVLQMSSVSQRFAGIACGLASTVFQSVHRLRRRFHLSGFVQPWPRRRENPHRSGSAARSGILPGRFIKSSRASGTLSTLPLSARVMPNPSLKRSANGMPPGPHSRYEVHFLLCGPGVMPSAPA